MIHISQAMSNIFENKTLKQVDCITLVKGEYDNCQFINCDLSNFDLSGYSFSDCSFSECNISSVKLNKTALKNIQMKDCKLLGLPFDHCSEFLFEVHFENCILNFSSFHNVNLKNSSFKSCTIHDVDFTQADLSALNMRNCDLLNSKFERTTLEKTDFRSAYNYRIDPETNRIKKAKFSKEGISGLLTKYDIIIE